MKIVMSLALFEAFQQTRQEFIADLDATAEFKPFAEERKALVASTKDLAHVGVWEDPNGNIEIVINDKLVRMLIEASNLYGQTVFQIMRVLDHAIPAFMRLFEKARDLFYQRQ